MKRFDLHLLAQVRGIAPSFVMWTILGLVSTLAFWERENSSTSFALGSGREGITPLLGILACALGSRLFAGDLLVTETAYWRSLPIDARARFGRQFALGVTAMALALVVFWAWFAAGWPHGLQRWLVADDVFDPMPTASAWSGTAAWMAWCFVVTTYFAATAQRAGWASQAGWPGFCSATILWGSDLRSWFEGDRWPAAAPWLTLAVLAAVPFFAARSGWPKRAATSTRTVDLIRVTPSAGQRIGNGIAHLILIALPIGITLRSADGIWPYVGLEPWAGHALLWTGLGLLALPWLIGQARRYRLSGGATIALLATGVTGFGSILWHAIRPHRADTRRPRVALPATLAISAFLAMILVPLALGGLRFVRAWDIIAPDDVEILVDGQRVGTGSARGLSWGSRTGPPLGLYQYGASHVVRLGADHDGVLRSTQLEATGDQQRGSRPLRVADVFAPDREIEFRRNGSRLAIQEVDVYQQVLSFRVHAHLRVELAD